MPRFPDDLANQWRDYELSSCLKNVHDRNARPVSRLASPVSFRKFFVELFATFGRRRPPETGIPRKIALFPRDFCVSKYFIRTTCVRVSVAFVRVRVLRAFDEIATETELAQHRWRCEARNREGKCEKPFVLAFFFRVYVTPLSESPDAL